MDDNKTNLTPSGNVGLPPLPEIPPPPTSPAQPEPAVVTTTTTIPVVPEPEKATTVTTTTAVPAPSVEEPLVPSPEVVPPTPVAPVTTTTTTTTVPPVPEKPKRKVNRKVLIGGVVVLFLAVAVVGIAALFPQFTGELRRKAYVPVCDYDSECDTGYRCSSGRCVFVGATATPTRTPTPTATAAPCTDGQTRCLGGQSQICSGGVWSNQGRACQATATATATATVAAGGCGAGSTSACSSKSVGGSCNDAAGNPGNCQKVSSTSTACWCVGTTSGCGETSAQPCRGKNQGATCTANNVSGTCQTTGGTSTVCSCITPTATATLSPCTHGSNDVCGYVSGGTCSNTCSQCSNGSHSEGSYYRCNPVTTATATPRQDSCGTGYTCASVAGGTACLNAGGDITSCTTAGGSSGNCCRPSGTGGGATATVTATATATGGVGGGVCPGKGGLNQTCRTPQNCSNAANCDAGLICTGGKCIPVTTCGADPNGCRLHLCDRCSNYGGSLDECRAGGTRMSCAEAEAALRDGCGQIDLLDANGNYCGVMQQACTGSCGGGTVTPTPTEPTGGAGCPFNSTQGQVHRNDSLPWADSIPSSSDANSILPGQSFIVGGFHNGTGQPAFDVSYQILSGSASLATHDASNADNWAYTYTVPANQAAGTLTVKTTTRGQTGSKCEDTATVTIGTAETNACVETRVYLRPTADANFSDTPTPVSELGSKVKVGDTIRLAVRGNKAAFVVGRFIVKRGETAVGTFNAIDSRALPGDPATKEYYYIYTVTEPGNYTFEGQVSITPL